ncbi:MAG TPA: SBBP repeat-containing protein [Polyangiaceae bacterium]|nr:SBBP repeat-containing protein [Polyangiaceae bacterium]
MRFFHLLPLVAAQLVACGSSDAPAGAEPSPYGGGAGGAPSAGGSAGHAGSSNPEGGAGGKTPGSGGSSSPTDGGAEASGAGGERDASSAGGASGAPGAGGSDGEAGPGSGGTASDAGSGGTASDAGGDGGSGVVASCGGEPGDAAPPYCPRGWVRQFGGPNVDEARGLAIDSAGALYVGGTVGGEDPGGPAIDGGSYDAYVRKMTPTGGILWTRQFGSAGDDVVFSVAADPRGGVAVSGIATAALPGQTAAGAWDVFVRLYDADGTELWTRQFGSAGYDFGSVAVDSNGNVIVSGSLEFGETAENDGGLGGAFVRKYDPNGTLLWTRRIAGATPDGQQDVVGSASADSAGNVYFGGATRIGLPGFQNAGGEDAVMRKWDASGAEQWTVQFGTTLDDRITAIDAVPGGGVAIAGRTFGALPTQTSSGGADAFVAKYAANGAEIWTRQFGTAFMDAATSVRVDENGAVLSAGTTTGTLPGATTAGSADGFVRIYDAAGAPLSTFQIGTSGIEEEISVASSPDGLFIAGMTNGAFLSSAGDFDAFVARVVP